MSADKLRIDIKKDGETFVVSMMDGAAEVGGFPSFAEAAAWVHNWLMAISRSAMADNTRRKYLGAILLEGKTKDTKPQ